MGSSLDQIGPITKNVADSQIVFAAIHGQDIKDSTTINDSTHPNKRIGDSSNRPGGKKKPVIGVPTAFLESTASGMGREASIAFHSSIDEFKSRGYEVVDIELPNNAYALAVYYVLMPAEVSSNMARYDGVKYGLHVDGKNGIEDYLKTRQAGFGREVTRRILLGTYVLSSGYYDAYYNRANAVRRIITEDFNKAFEKVDIIAMPTTPGPAFKIGEKSNDPVAMYLEDIFTVTANLTGMPAISIPCGNIPDKSGQALPLGLQLTARHGDEAALFEAGKEFLGEIE